MKLFGSPDWPVFPATLLSDRDSRLRVEFLLKTDSGYPNVYLREKLFEFFGRDSRENLFESYGDSHENFLKFWQS